MIFQKNDTSSLSIVEAQYDMRIAYCGGAPGVLASALVWLCATTAALFVAPQEAVWVLFVGAMFIHPVAVLLCKMVGQSGKSLKENPFAMLAGASTFWLIFSCPLAYAASLVNIEWFFPSMLLAIGGRYMIFATIYGMRIYWVCGFSLAISAYILAAIHAAPAVGALSGALIEALFAALIFKIWKSDIEISIKPGDVLAGESGESHEIKSK